MSSTKLPDFNLQLQTDTIGGSLPWGSFPAKFKTFASLCTCRESEVWSKLTSQMPHDPVLQPVSIVTPALSATCVFAQSDVAPSLNVWPYDIKKD